MGEAKRSGGDLTRSVHRSKRACSTTEWVSGRLHDEEDVFSQLPDRVKSDFSKSVASICLCNGGVTLFSCSGIAISRQGHNLTKFLTSASLVRAFDGKNTEYYNDLKIVVQHEDKKVHRGVLDEHDLDHNFAVVTVCSYVDVHVGIFHRVLPSPCGEACVVSRDVSGDLMVRSVVLGGELSVSKDDKDLDSKISKAWEGASVFSFGGEFVGMNLFMVTGRAVFLPWGTICKHLDSYCTFLEKKTGLARTKIYGFGAHKDYKEAGLRLTNPFEDTFGDTRGKGVWKRLGSKAAASIGRNVVALASFNGEKMVFACTGFFIGWNGSTFILTSASLIRNSGDENKIVENLKIKVSLPSNEHRDGTLEHYSLHYNVALVSVKGRPDLRLANTRLSLSKCFQVAAVGRRFDSGALMAVSGKLVPWSGTLDCDFLLRSSCKIKMVGIGGPLVTLDGDFIGMNFYDTKIGTPYLPWHTISMILGLFDGKPADASSLKIDGDHTARLNRWPVPMPEDDVDKDSDSEDDDNKHDYFRGEKLYYL